MKPVSPTFFIVMAIREAEMQLGDFNDECVCERARLLLGWPADDEHESAVSNVYRSMQPSSYQLNEGGGGDDASTIYTYFTASSREDSLTRRGQNE